MNLKPDSFDFYFWKKASTTEHIDQQTDKAQMSMRRCVVSSEPSELIYLW